MLYMVISMGSRLQQVIDCQRYDKKINLLLFKGMLVRLNTSEALK